MSNYLEFAGCNRGKISNIYKCRLQNKILSNNLLKDFMGVDTPFGSRVFGGDFMQTLPVKPLVSRGKIITNAVK